MAEERTIATVNRKSLVRSFTKKIFPLAQGIGIHVVPNHFYGPVPDTRELDNRLWQRESSMVGMSLDLGEQSAHLERFANSFGSFFSQIAREDTDTGFRLGNGMFESVDAEILYAFVRSNRPQRVVEIGSGYSTRLIAQALNDVRLDDPGFDSSFTVIDPYIHDDLRNLRQVKQVHSAPLQTVDIDLFLGLEAGDILFIDSSHVLKIGSDVQMEYLEILPRLHQGVLVHVHDVFLPKEYPREWVCDRQLFWNEQYLLQAFLAFNDAFKVLWAAHLMHLRMPDLLELLVPSYDRRYASPGSFWFVRSG